MKEKHIKKNIKSTIRIQQLRLLHEYFLSNYGGIDVGMRSHTFHLLYQQNGGNVQAHAHPGHLLQMLYSSAVWACCMCAAGEKGPLVLQVGLLLSTGTKLRPLKHGVLHEQNWGK